MIVETSFNEEIYKSQMFLIFNSHFDKSLHNTKIIFYYGLLILFIALVSCFQFDKITTFEIIGLLIGALFIAFSFFLNQYYKFQKKDYKVKVDLKVKEYLNANQKRIIEITEEFIMFKNFELEIKILWQGIKHYVVSKDYLIIGIQENTPLLIFSREETKEHFDNILSIVKNKIIIK